MTDIGLSKNHPSWTKFRDLALKPRLEDLRTKLENMALTTDQTAAIRGEIAGIRAIIAMVEAAPEPSIHNC